MKVLVTGASGFIGSALVRRLEAEGHDVWGMYRHRPDGRYNPYEARNKVFGDLKDASGVYHVLEKVQPEVVFHLGAITPVYYSFINPIDVVETTFGGTVNLAHACLDFSVEHFIFAATSEVYGATGTGLTVLDETMPCAPISPYAAAKHAAEIYIQSLGRTHGLPWTIIRPFNTFNRSQVNQKYFVVEKTINQALTTGLISLFDPNPIRDLLDRDSHVDGYVKAMEHRMTVMLQIINVCRGQGITIEGMAELISLLVGEEYQKTVEVFWEDHPDRPADIQTLIGSNIKAWELLGWKPLYSFEDGIRIAIQEWAEVLGVKRGG